MAEGNISCSNVTFSLVSFAFNRFALPGPIFKPLTLPKSSRSALSGHVKIFFLGPVVSEWRKATFSHIRQASSGFPLMVMLSPQNSVTLQGDTIHGNEALSPICLIFATKYMLVYNSGLLHFFAPTEGSKVSYAHYQAWCVPLEGDMVPFVLITSWGT